MKRFIIPFSLSGALLLGGCWHTDRMDSSKIRASGPLAEEDVRETKYYKNGVFRTDGDIYSVFHSGDWIFGISGNRMIESSDMVHWLRMGRGTFAADDCRVARNSGLDIARLGERYLMAYIAPEGNICVAEASRIRGPYGAGRLLLSSAGKELGGCCNPSFCTGKDGRWLVWDAPGGIYMGRFNWDSASPSVSEPKHIGGPGLCAPRIFGKEGMYYLWATIRDGHGGLAVGRSRNIEGPYYTADGLSMKDAGGVTPTVIPNSDFSDISNVSGIITDANHDDWLLYHARANVRGEWQTVLMLDKIMWDNGWPVMGKYHASVASQRSPRL